MNSNARPNVLIVDDSLGNIELLGNILSAEYGVSFASSGQEGLDLANRYPMDLILLDVVMPGIDGFEVCRQLKADAKTRDIPVVFLTSLESAVDEEFGLRLGAEDFIHKPVSPPVVLARVRSSPAPSANCAETTNISNNSSPSERRSSHSATVSSSPRRRRPLLPSARLPKLGTTKPEITSGEHKTTSAYSPRSCARIRVSLAVLTTKPSNCSSNQRRYMMSARSPSPTRSCSSRAN